VKVSVQNPSSDGWSALNPAEQRLLESALVLFARKGYEGTSVREIIEAARVTRPVLYYYFENKEKLFVRLVEAVFAYMTAYCEEVYARFEGCRTRLVELARRTFAGAEMYPDAVRLLLQVLFVPCSASPSLNYEQLLRGRFDIIESIMRDGIESGELPGGEPKALALAFAGLMDEHVMARLHWPSSPLAPELGEWLVTLFLNGAGRVGNGGCTGSGEPSGLG
jgi:AcrR family transcriptional regulator